MLKRTFLSGLLLLVAVLPLAAQEINPLQNMGAAQSEVSNRLGVAIGILGGFGDGSSALLSAMYTRSILQGVELELSFQHSALSRAFGDPPTQSSLPDYSIYFRNYSTIDGTVLLAPFSNGFLSGFRFGAGATFQFREQGSVRTVPVSLRLLPDSLAAVLRTYPPTSYAYRNGLVFGGHLKIDYVIPLSKMIDIGLRTQAHVLLLRLTGDDPVKVFADGTGSASIFLRVGF